METIFMLNHPSISPKNDEFPDHSPDQPRMHS
jgi:hypothetical protein